MATNDPLVNVANQQLQGGALWSIGGQLDIDTVAGGTLTIDGVAIEDEIAALAGQPATITITRAAGGSNISLVTFTVKDADGNAIAAPTLIDIWLSDAATGAGLTGTTASGAVSAGASGVDWSIQTTKKALRVQTTAAGVYILSITDTAKTGFYPCAAIPGKLATVGAVLVTGSYG